METLEHRRLLATDTIAIVATHGQQGCVLNNPSADWPGAIASSMREEVEAFTTRLGASSLIAPPPRVRTTYVKWDTCGAIERSQLTEVVTWLDGVIDDAGGPIDVVMFGHSRGSIFTNRLAQEIQTHHSDVAANLDHVYGIYLDPTAARPFGDNYPSHRPALMDRLIVYDDELAFDRDIPVALGKAKASSAGCAAGATAGTIFGGPIGGIVGCAVGYVAGGYAAEYAAETLERWGVEIRVGTTVDTQRVGGSDYRRVGEPVDDYINSNPDGQARGAQNVRKAGYKSLSRHMAIHRWYAQSNQLSNDMTDFLRDRNPLASAISIKNDSGGDVSYTFNWSGRGAETFQLGNGSTRRHWIQQLDASASISFIQNGTEVRYRLGSFLTSNVPPTTEDTRSYRFLTRNNSVDLYSAPLRPDLLATRASVNVRAPDSVGLSIVDVDMTIANQGQTQASDVEVEFFASTGTTIQSNSRWLGRLPVGDIGVGGSRRLTLPFRIPPSLRSSNWTINYRIKSANDELRYSNNEGNMGRHYLRNVAPTDDEPNDTAGLAELLTRGGLAEGRDPTPLQGGLEFKTLHAANDVDYYRIALDSFAGAGSVVGLNFDVDFGNIDFRLLDSNGTSVGRKRQLSPGAEVIDLDYLPKGDYFLEVTNTGGTRIEYTLSRVMYPRGLPKDATDGDSLETEQPARVTNPGAYSFAGALYTTGDTDAFAFELNDWAAEGSQLSLTHEPDLGHLRLAVINDDISLALSAESTDLGDGRVRRSYDLSYLPPGEYTVYVGPDWVVSDRSTWDRYFDINRYTIQFDIDPLGEYVDLYESNGTVDQATDVREILGYDLPSGWQYRPLPNRRRLSTISPPLETDYIDFSLVGWGQSKNGVTLQPESSALDVLLETIEGTIVTSETAPAGEATFLSLEGYAPGDFRLRVRGIDPEFTTYDVGANRFGIEEDALEPNNTMENPVVLEAGLGSRELTIHRITDEDWFRFELERIGKSQNQLSIENMGPQDNLIGSGQLTLELFDSTGEIVGNTVLEDGVQVTKLTGLPAGEYFARVSGKGQNTNRYRLRYDTVTTARLPFVIGKDGYPVTRITNTAAVDEDPLVQEGIVYWASSESDSDFWDLMMFDTTTPNARPEPIAVAVDSWSSEPPVFHVESNYIVWQAHDGSDYEIFLFDGSIIRKLTDDANDDRNPRVHDGHVVWQSRPFRNSDWEIMLFDENGIRPLTSNSYDDAYPQIADDVIAWQGNVGGADSEIFYQHRFDDAPTRITNNSVPDFMGDTSCAGSQSGCRPQVQVTPTRIVWRSDVNGGSVGSEEFWYYDIDQQESHKLFVSGSLSFDPVASDSFIAWQSIDFNIVKTPDGVWQGQEADSYNIFVYDGVSVRQLTDYGIGDFRFAEFPWAMGDRLIWHQDAPNGQIEIMVYEDEVIRQLTDNEFNEVHFREGDGQVVWANYEEGSNTDIYLIDIAPQSIRGNFLVDEAVEGTEEVILRLRREFASTDTQLSVSLTPEFEGQLEFPSVVSFAGGEETIDVPVHVLDNALLDGDRIARILATSPGFQFAEAELLIRDHEELAVEVNVNDSIVFEDDGEEAVALRVYRLDESLDESVDIDLQFDPDDTLFNDQEITIAAGESYVDLWLAVRDNQQIDGLRDIQITATADGFVASQTSVQVADAESIRVMINGNSEGSSLAEGETFQLTVSRESLVVEEELTVFLSTNLPDDLDLPDNVVLEPGVAEKTIEVSVVDLEFADGLRQLDVIATADGLDPGVATASLSDNDQATLVFDYGSATILQQLQVGAEITLFLNREPTADVTLNLNPRGGVTATPATLTFNSDNWRTGVTSTLSANPAPDEEELLLLIRWGLESDDAAFGGLGGQEIIISQASDEVVPPPLDRINALAAAIQAGDVTADITGDGEIDFDDLHQLVKNELNTHFGDANLDGTFNSTDLVQVFRNGLYEDTIDGNATWLDGDWNGDGDFDSSDLVVAFQDGGYTLASTVGRPGHAIDRLFAGLSDDDDRVKRRRQNM